MQLKGELLGQMTWQFFYLIFIFNQKEPQICQFATYWQKLLFDILTSQTGKPAFINFNVVIKYLLSL